MPEKFELASRRWFEEAFRLFREAAEADPEVRFSVCEVFTDVPERLGPGEDGRIAWHAFLANGRAEVAFGEVDEKNVDVKTIAEWEAVLPAARAVIDLADPEGLARYQRLSADAIAAGRIQRFGDSSKAPLSLIGIHNALARHTA